MRCGRRGASGEQAPRCPESHHQSPRRHDPRAAHRHLMDRHSGWISRQPRWTGGRERPRPPGRRAGERQRSAVRPPWHPASTRVRPAGLLYVPKMSASRLTAVSRRASCGRWTHWGCGSRAPKWSRRQRHCLSPQHRGRLVLTVAGRSLNRDAFASLLVLAWCDSDGPVRFGSRRPQNGLLAITNVMLTMRSSMSGTTSPSLPGTVIRPSCLRHDGVLRKRTTLDLVPSSPNGPANHGRRCAAPSPNSTTPRWWNPVVFRRWSP